MQSLRLGVKVELVFHSLMPVCGNYALKVGCTTEYAWLWHRSYLKTYTSNGNEALTISLTGSLMEI